MGSSSQDQFVRKSKANTPSKNQVQPFLVEKCITHKFEVFYQLKGIGYEQG